MNTLTVEQGIKYQQEDLDRWATVLKPEVFKVIEQEVMGDNHLAKTGYDVCRGDGVYAIICNYSYALERKNRP